MFTFTTLAPVASMGPNVEINVTLSSMQPGVDASQQNHKRINLKFKPTLNAIKKLVVFSDGT